jgi:hypothetical protein
VPLTVKVQVLLFTSLMSSGVLCYIDAIQKHMMGSKAG